MKYQNIVFIVLDTLRADRVLSEYKNKNLTPNINNLLKNSIYFENCIANSPWTLPSHISMFTGLYPTETTLISKKVDRISNKTPLLTEILKDMGYFTVCFSENAFISKIYGLSRGFDEILNVWDWNPWIKEKYKLSQFFKLLNKFNLFLKKKIKSKLFLKIWAYINNRTEKLIKTIIKYLFLKNILFKLKNQTIKDLEKFFQSLKDNINNKPFYLFFNFLTTHDPYIPLKSTFKSFDITIKDFKIIKDIIIDPLKYRLNVDIKSDLFSEKQIKVIKKLYNACVFSSDIVVKKLISNLIKKGLIENTHIIITSDHGEHLCDQLDHYFWEHNTYQSVYESLMRVPLIIYNSNFKKKIIKDQVQLKDLFHTILHLTGIPSSQNKYLDKKKSIMYQINNDSTPKYIFGEYLKSKDVMIELINAHRRTINKNLIPKIFNHIYFIRSNKIKYIKYNAIKIEEFYNLSSDPHEQTNIANENNKNYKNIKIKIENLLENIKNPKKLIEIITEREKDLIKKTLTGLKSKEFHL